MTFDVPEWVTAYIHVWRDRLLLSEWRLTLALALCVNDDPDVRALCQQYCDNNRAIITFRADIENTTEWREVIIHELLHIRHARIDHRIECAFIPELASAAQQMAQTIYHQDVEAYTEAMTHTLYRATSAADYPDEPQS